MKKRRGIRKKVTYTVTLLVIISLTLLGLVLATQIFITQKNQHLKFQNEVVDYAINEISWDIHEIETLLNITVNDYDLLNSNSGRSFTILSQVLTNKDIKHHNILDELILVDREGKEVARVSRTSVFTSNDLSERSDSGLFSIPKKTGEIYYGPLSFEETTYEPFVMLSLPIMDFQKGSVNGVLIGKIRLNRIWENAVVRSFGESGIIFITDSEGKIVAHPDPSIIFRNTFYKTDAPQGIQPGIHDKSVLLASDRFTLGNNTFIVYAVLPFMEIINLSLETLSTTAAFIIIFILLSTLMSLFVVNRIVRPIEFLADNARKISAGRFTPTAEVGDADEIGDLSNAFNTMTSRLLETIKSLQKQMTERKKMEEKLQQHNELLNNILNSLTHPFYVINAHDYTITMANPAARFGRITDKSTCYALTHKRDKPCDSIEHPCVIRKIKETRKPTIVEHIHYDRDGGTEITEVHGYPIFDNEGNISQVIEYNVDITTRKLAEDKIKSSLREKEVLLREIHHRVKNNMQIISSLLSLQASALGNIKDASILQDSRNRIRSMSLIHEKLYKSEDLAQIDIKEYINDLAAYISQFYRHPGKNIFIKIEAEDIKLMIDTAIPCGLIINELLTNSLKYAFPEKKEGEINIIFRRREEEYELIVSDNGAGIPEELDFRNSTSLGLRLVNALSEDQLQGSVELHKNNGTEFRIRFKEATNRKKTDH